MTRKRSQIRLLLLPPFFCGYRSVVGPHSSKVVTPVRVWLAAPLLTKRNFCGDFALFLPPNAQRKLLSPERLFPFPQKHPGLSSRLRFSFRHKLLVMKFCDFVYQRIHDLAIDIVVRNYRTDTKQKKRKSKNRAHAFGFPETREGFVS